MINQSASSRHLQTIDFATLFASNIHDIKNLLFLLLGSLDETINKTAENADSKHLSHLSALKYNGQLINDKLIQMLALFSMAQEHYQINLAYYSVEELIEDMVIESKPLLIARSITISGDIEDGLCWFFDQGLVGGIISNAIHNAIGHAKNTIKINAYRKNDMLHITVEDDGNGFPQRLLNNSDAIRTLNITEGKTGLGLYFSSVSAQMHVNKDKSGSILLNNGGDLKGAVFTLQLP